LCECGLINVCVCVNVLIDVCRIRVCVCV